MSATPYWSCPAEEFPPSGVIALFDTAKDDPELTVPVTVSVTLLVTPAITLAPVSMVQAANDSATPSMFERAMAWLRGKVVALVALASPPRALPAAGAR